MIETEYDVEAIRRAGQVIGGDLTWKPENEDRIREAFSIANQWRDSHSYPMRSMHQTLRALIRLRDIEGVTAARLKRMNAIRGKLRRLSDRRRPLSLHEFQDLGGCRAIMKTMQSAETLIAELKARERHVLWNEDRYMYDARPTGYRSHHLKFEFSGKGEYSKYSGRRIEVQIRTDLQHAWATAVEAIGLFRGEELKSGKGSPEWLRFFALMSAEFAEAEKCDPAKGLPDRAARIKELKDLDGFLGAAQVLENLSTAVHWAEDAVKFNSKPDYYLITYNNETRNVTVEPHYRSRIAIHSYEDAERPDNLSGQDTANVVLIEANKMDSLTKAYPNYFGDVQLFKMQLSKLLNGGVVQEYEIDFQKRSILPPRERPDPSWIGRRGMWTEPKPAGKKLPKS